MAVEKNCVDCKNPFTISDEEEQWFKNKIDDRTGKSFTLPTRCKDCRKRRKEERQTSRS